jgi:hypothetical protein
MGTVAGGAACHRAYVGNCRATGGEFHLRRRQILVDEAAINARFVIERVEQAGKTTHGLGAPQHQQAVMIQRIIEHRHQLLLQCGSEIDQQIAAGEEVDFRERRVGDDVLRRKNDHLPYLPVDPVTRFLANEEERQPLRRNVSRNVVRIEALARPGNGLVVDISGIDLQGITVLRPDFIQCLLENDGQRIGLLAGGAGRYPGAQRSTARMARHQPREAGVAQADPHVRVTEEAGDPDQQFLEQQVELLRIRVQVTHIRVDSVQLMQRNTPLDTAVKRTGLILGKIVSGTVA